MPAVPAAPMSWFRTDGLLRGVAVAAIAAVAATLIWYAVVATTSFQIGLVAALVGWVIGTGAVLGAGGRGSIWLVGASVALTLLALTIGEYLIAYHYVTGETGLSFDLIQSPMLIIEIVVAVLSSDPVTLLFWAFALLAAAWVPFKAIGASPTGSAQPTPTGSPQP